MNGKDDSPRAGHGWTTATGMLVLAWLLAAIVLQVGPIYQSARLSRLETEKRSSEAAEKEALAVRHRAALTARYLDRSRSALECWREIATLLPPGVEIDSFAAGFCVATGLYR